MSTMTSKLVILFSGKRKSGKEFLATGLLAKIGESIAEIIRISEPIIKQFAKNKKLSVEELSGPLKEKYRKEMMEWSERVRTQLPTYFSFEAFKGVKKPITIVSDVRLRTDVEYFTSLSVPVLAVRVNASDEEREERGWQFTEGIDDVASECDLDNFDEWDFVINNLNDTQPNAECIFQDINGYVQTVLKAYA